MPKHLPPSLAESLLEPQHDNPEPSEVIRVLGGVSLPGEEQLSRMGRGDSNPESGNLSWEIAHEVHAAAANLFAEMLPSLYVPELSAFTEAGVDFAKLQAGYNAYAQAGMAPELVIFPANLAVDEWRQTYSNLRQWQAKHYPNSRYKLNEYKHGDGLYLWQGIEQNWDELNHIAIADAWANVPGADSRAWKAIVVPAVAGKPAAANTNHDLTYISDVFRNQAIVINTAVPTADNAHMPIGAYLTLQAAHIIKDIPPIDGTTWNKGTFTYARQHEAPASYWSSTYGQVIGSYHVSKVFRTRLPVWG